MINQILSVEWPSKHGERMIDQDIIRASIYLGWGFNGILHNIPEKVMIWARRRRGNSFEEGCDTRKGESTLEKELSEMSKGDYRVWRASRRMVVRGLRMKTRAQIQRGDDGF